MRDLERVTWRDGQRLASADLRDDRNLHDRLRQLHIRYLHKIWGIVEGLRVQSAGDAAVFVRAGYALTSAGEELLLPRAFTIQAPPHGTPAATYYVVISPAGLAGHDAGCDAPTDVSQLCPGVTNPIVFEQGVISWKTVKQVRYGVDILLARIAIANGKIASIIDLSVANRAIPRSQRSWSDTTPAGSTGWKTSNGSLQTIIDLSDAGFVAAPVCFAQVMLPGATKHGVRGYIASVSNTGFTYVLRPAALPGSTDAFAAAPAPELAESAGWTVSWTAVEITRTRSLFPVGALLGKLK